MIKYCVAPLEGVSDEGFRKLCYSLGKCMTWTEMIRCSAILRNNSSSLDLIDTFDDNIPTGVQLLTKSAFELKQAMNHLQKLSYSTKPHFKNIKDIQLNFGCPSPEIISSGDGPAMLKRKQRLTDIFKTLVEFRESNNIGVKSVGVKIRLGLNQTEMNQKIYMNAVDSSNLSNIDYLVVHVRHAKQKSSELPHWLLLREIRENLNPNIQLIGNGNVFTKDDALMLKDQTGISNVMLARGIIKNPWILRDFISENNIVSAVTWPTLQELNQAEMDYLDWSISRGSRNPKYSEFHKSNFQRIRQCIESNDYTLKVLNPSKVYL